MNNGIDVQAIRGPYSVRKAGGRRPPVSHQTFGDAERAAGRLIAEQPEDTFIISQEVALVRRCPKAA